MIVLTIIMIVTVLFVPPFSGLMFDAFETVRRRSLLGRFIRSSHQFAASLPMRKLDFYNEIHQAECELDRWVRKHPMGAITEEEREVEDTLRYNVIGLKVARDIECGEEHISSITAEEHQWMCESDWRNGHTS